MGQGRARRLRRIATGLVAAGLMLTPAATAAERAPLVFGGGVAPEGDWGWAVALVEHGEPSAGEGQFCSGTLVAPAVVVTAAHCLLNDKTSKTMAPARVDVVTGRLDLGAKGGQRIPAAELRIHPDYSPEHLGNDIGVVILSEPSTAPVVRFGDDPDRAAWRPGRKVYVGGWGFTRLRQWPRRLHVARIPVRQDWLCALVYGPDWIGAKMICGGGLDAATGCPGDSGGPLIALTADGTPVLAGVTSTGSAFCTPDYRPPGSYTDLSAFDHWLRVQIPGAPPATGREPPNDTAPPHVTALRASGGLGQRIGLPYRVYDDSGVTHEIVLVYEGDRLIKRIAQGDGPASPAIVYRAPWPAPAERPGARLHFCVRSFDPTGNRSAAACAAIQLR